MSILPDDAAHKHQPAHVEGELASVVGEPHVRTPVPAREQSTLESLSSAFRGLGSMARASTQPTRSTAYASSSMYLGSPALSNNLMLSDDDGGPDETLYSAKQSMDFSGDESIIWSGWDEINWDGQSPSRLLFLGYRTGIQVWDCTHEQVREVLNLLSPTLGSVVGAAVIPAPAPSQDDLLAEQRPLVCILTSRPDAVLIYSLRTHTIVRRMAFGSPQAVQASDQFIVISTVAPPALHILNSATLDHLSTIAAPHVASPVFGLSRRLLAYASTPPPPSTSPTPTPTTHSPSKVQADISMAIEGARKVGAGMWSGVKTLLKDTSGPRSTVPYSPRSPPPMSPPSHHLVMSPRIYSRSAPSESTYSTGTAGARASLAPGDGRPAVSQGHVTVVDLLPLLDGSSPRRIVQHHATPGQAIGVIAFSRAGNMLAVTGIDGICVRVFEVRPKGRYSPGGPQLTKRDELNDLDERDTGGLWHWYDLQRGLTRRRITDIVWSPDSKWLTAVTVRGTLHVFAINPYGGAPTGASHMLGSGRVVNMVEPQRAPISLSPLVRIHMSSPAEQALGVPIVATFGRPSKTSRESAAQDIFVLNRATGELSLKQCVLRMQPVSTLEASMSLPSALSNSVTGLSGLSNVMRGAVGGLDRDETVLGAVEAVGRTWGVVKREREWGEVRRSVEKAKLTRVTKVSKPRWLAQAEITTCTRSTRLLPGPIYLSHQFAFYALCQDWEALLQQSHLELPAERIVVRREVSARPVADSGSDGTFLGSDKTSSSLDAPLASALEASLTQNSAAAQIPSYPNAYSGGKSMSWKAPVKRLTYIGEGLKREIGRVRPPGPGLRSPRSPSSTSTTSGNDTQGIQLRFDDDALFEVDEDLPPGSTEGPTAGLQALREDEGSRSAGSGSGSVPSTVPDMTHLATPDLIDWGEGSVDEDEYTRAREHDSQFDDLVVGLMDEEEEERRVMMGSTMAVGRKTKKR